MLKSLIINLITLSCALEVTNSITNDEDIINEVISALQTNKYHKRQSIYLRNDYKSEELKKIFSDRLGNCKTDRDIILNLPYDDFIRKQYVEINRAKKIEDVGQINMIYQSFDKPPESLNKLLTEQLSTRNQDLLFKIGGARNLPDIDLMYFVIPSGDGIKNTHFFLVEVNYLENKDSKK